MNYGFAVKCKLLHTSLQQHTMISHRCRWTFNTMSCKQHYCNWKRARNDDNPHCTGQECARLTMHLFRIECIHFSSRIPRVPGHEANLSDPVSGNVWTQALATLVDRPVWNFQRLLMVAERTYTVYLVFFRYAYVTYSHNNYLASLNKWMKKMFGSLPNHPKRRKYAKCVFSEQSSR